MRTATPTLLLALAASPAIARSADSFAVAELVKEAVSGVREGSDGEKARIARYGLNQSRVDPDNEIALDATRFRWKLNRVKMRMPFSTAGLQ